MKKLILLSCVLILGACGTPAVVLIPAVFGVGTAINVENSGNPVDDLGEAIDRVVDDVEDGYSRDHFVGYNLNN